MKRLLFLLMALVLIGPAYAALSDNLRNCWPLDETSGTTADDVMGNMDGTIYNTPALNQAGKIGTSYLFEATQSEYVDISNAVDNGLTNNGFTVTFWTKMSAGSTVGYSVMFNDGASDHYLGAVRRDDNDDCALNYDNTGGAGGITATCSSYDWIHHIYRVWANGSVEYRVDNVYKGTTTANGDYNMGLGAFGCSLYSGTCSTFFDAGLDEVKIWNRTLTNAEMTADYNAGSGVSCASLLPAAPGPTYPPESFVFAVNSNLTKGNYTNNPIRVRLTGSHNYTYDYSIPNFFAYYPFEGNANDVRKRNNGTVSGAIKVTGKTGFGYGFDGTNDYISLGDLNLNIHTITGWFKQNESGTQAVYSASADPIYAEARTNGLKCCVNSGGETCGTSSSVPAVGSWNFFVCRYDGANICSAINGETLNCQAKTGTLTSNTNPLLIGQLTTDAGAESFNGTIDSIRIYNRSLSTDQIREVYTSERPFYDCNLTRAGTVVSSFTNANISTVKYLNWTTTGVESTYNMTVTCTDYFKTSKNSVFMSVDTIQPNYNYFTPANGSIIFRNIRPALNFSINASDTNLFAMNISVFMVNALRVRVAKINGTLIQGITATKYKYNYTRPLTLFTPAEYEIHWQVWDSHTANELKHSPKVKDKVLDYNGVKFYCDNAAQVNYFAEKDRIKPAVTFSSKATVQTCYYESANLTKVQNSEYPGHYVDLEKGIWIDEYDGQVEQVAKNKIKITWSRPEGFDYIVTDSIGDLNKVQASIFVTIADPFRFYAKDATNNETINIFTILVPSLNRTQSTTNGVLYINITSGSYATNITSLLYTPNGSTVTYSANGSKTYFMIPSNSLNMFFYDEKTDVLLTNPIYFDVINYANQSYSFNTTVGYRFIAQFVPGDYEIRYRSAGFNPRTRYVTIASNTTQTVRLYLLNSSYADYISFSVEDETGNTLENATVAVTRFYTGCNCYRVVEQDKANFEGEAILSLEKYITRYNFIVTYKGEVVYMSTAGYKLTQDSYSLTATLLGDTTQSYFAVNQDIASIIAYNNATKLFSFTVGGDSALVDHFCIYVDQLNALRSSGYARICNNCLTATSGTVTCNISSYYGQGREIVAKGFIETTTEYSSYWSDVLSIITDTSGRAALGPLGVFLTFLFAGTLGFIGLVTGGLAFGIIGLNAGVIVSSMIGIIEIPLYILIGAVVSGIIVAFLVGERD